MCLWQPFTRLLDGVQALGSESAFAAHEKFVETQIITSIKSAEAYKSFVALESHEKFKRNDLKGNWNSSVCEFYAIYQK